MTVAAILKHKGNDVTTVRPTADVAEVARLLTERRIGSAVVQDTEGQLLGIVNERDIVAALAEHGPAALRLTVDHLMTRALTTATKHTSVAEAMAMMTAGRFRHIPVLEDGQLIGIISIGDVVKARIMAQEGEVESLRAYVAGAA